MKNWNKQYNKYRTYIKSKEWKKLRLDIYKIRKGVCERCGHNLNFEFHLHHKIYDNLFNEKLEDLEILCLYCHLKEHNLLTPKNKKQLNKRTLKRQRKIKKLRKDMKKSRRLSRNAAIWYISHP